ncbi:putative group II intron protein, partial [Streptococcus pneumoniae]
MIIWKQWKKKSRRLWGLLKLGVPKWIADKVSGWGD